MIDIKELKLYDLYVLYCEQNEQQTSTRDFIIWIQERYENEQSDEPEFN